MHVYIGFFYVVRSIWALAVFAHVTHTREYSQTPQGIDDFRVRMIIFEQLSKSHS